MRDREAEGGQGNRADRAGAGGKTVPAQSYGRQAHGTAHRTWAMMTGFEMTSMILSSYQITHCI